MKKWIAIVCMICVLAVFVFLLIPQKKNEDAIAIIQKKYHIHTQSVNVLKVPVFTNREREDIVTEYTYGFLHNKDETKKILVDTFSQSKIHDEVLNQETYYGYEIAIKLPEISGTMSIDELYLTVYDGMGDQTYQLGSFHLTSESDQTDLFKLTGLSGTKNDFMHLKQIYLTVDNPNLISKIVIGGYEQDFFISGNDIVVNIIQDEMYYNDPYLMIYSGDAFQIVGNFTYFTHYQLLFTNFYQVYPY